MNTRFYLPLVAVLALTACGDVTGSDAGLDADEVSQLSESVVLQTFGATSEVATAGASYDDGTASLRLADLTATTQFTHTRSCVLGGQVVNEGTRVREWDRTERSGSMELEMTRTHQECARPLRWQAPQTDDGVTVTLTGAPGVEVNARHEWQHGQRHGFQSLSMEGAIDWSTDDGRSGTCTIDIETEFDPATWTRTTVGTFCNHEIDRTTTWETGSDDA